MLWIKNKVEVFQREIFSHRERRTLSTVLGKAENRKLFQWFIFAKLFLSNAHLLKNALFQNWKLLAKSGNLLIRGIVDEKARSPMILSQLLNTAQPENLEVFMEIHFCYRCVVLIFCFSSSACPKNTKVTLWLDPRRQRSMFPLDAHVASAEIDGICLLVSILHMKLKHLPPHWSNFCES